MERIEKMSSAMAEEDEKLVIKLRDAKYEGFTGKRLDQLWVVCLSIKDREKEQDETAEFIKIKEDEVKGISEHF